MLRLRGVLAVALLLVLWAILAMPLLWIFTRHRAPAQTLAALAVAGRGLCRCDRLAGRAGADALRQRVHAACHRVVGSPLFPAHPARPAAPARVAVMERRLDGADFRDQLFVDPAHAAHAGA